MMKEIGYQRQVFRKDDEYTDCHRCHSPLSHCHCTCPYCGERDDCECALFEAATGG